MGEYIHTKFWIGGDISRPVAKQLIKAIIDEEMFLADDACEEQQFEPQSVTDLVKARTNGVLALFEYEKNYGECLILEHFCNKHSIPWQKWHSFGGDFGSSFYWWEPGMSKELMLNCTHDRDLLIEKKAVDEVIELFKTIVHNDPNRSKSWEEHILEKLCLASPVVPELPPFRIIEEDGRCKEDIQLAKAVELLEEAARIVSAVDFRAVDAILTLARDLEPKEKDDGR